MGRHLQLVQLQQLVRGRVRGRYGSTGTHGFALSSSLLTAISALQQSNVLRAALSTCRSLYSPSCLQTRTFPHTSLNLSTTSTTLPWRKHRSRWVSVSAPTPHRKPKGPLPQTHQPAIVPPREFSTIAGGFACW